MRKYYSIIDDGGGGDKLPPPPNYKPLSVDQRTQWNSFLDYAGKQNVDFDKDPKAGVNLMTAYKKNNPNFSLTPNDIAAIQYEQYQLRKGDAFGTLKPEQLKYLRQGLPATYLNRPLSDVNGQLNSATVKLYYPQKTTGGKSWGTDIESYVNGVGGQPVNVDETKSLTNISNLGHAAITDLQKNEENAALTKAQAIGHAAVLQLPDYNDPVSRLKYAKDWAKKHGIEEGYGDIPLRVNERPYTGTDTSKNMAITASKSTGLDPALVYASSMVEGASGLYPGKDGKVRYGDDPDYKVQGSAFGLNNFVSRVPEMIKKGYLPENFDYKKRSDGSPNSADSADFKNFQDGMQAHAARLKLDYDEIDDYAKKQGISLSPQAKDFFALAHFNSGLGKQMLDKYSKNGWLKGDQFMKGNPDGSYPEVYKHVILRLKEAGALKKEGEFQ